MHNPNSSIMLTKDQWITLLLAVITSRIVFAAFGLIGTYSFNPEAIKDIDIWHQMCRFDCVWFRRIAEDGYALVPSYMRQSNGANWAFMPMSPYLAKTVNYVVNNINLSLVLVSNVTLIAGTAALVMALKQMKLSNNAQDTAIWLMCFSPYTVYSLAGYSEPLYIALVAGLFIACYRQNWLLVAVLGMLAAVTRNLGVMLVFSVLIIGIQHYGLSSFYRFKTRGLAVIAAIWVIPLGFFTYMAYLYFHMGDALAFGHIQVAWGRTFSNPFVWLEYGFERGGPKLYLTIVSLLGFALNGYLIYKKRYAEALFLFINLVIPLSSGVNAMPRYIFGLYPTYLAIILLLESYPRAKMPVLLCGAAMSTFISIGFFSSSFFTV